MASGSVEIKALQGNFGWTVHSMEQMKIPLQ